VFVVNIPSLYTLHYLLCLSFVFSIVKLLQIRCHCH